VQRKVPEARYTKSPEKEYRTEKNQYGEKGINKGKCIRRTRVHGEEKRVRRGSQRRCEEKF